MKKILLTSLFFGGIFCNTFNISQAKTKFPRHSVTQILNNYYSRDAHNVYYKHQPVYQADPNSFYILPVGDDYKKSNYGQDVNGIYYRTQRIKNADPTTFQIIDSHHAEDQYNSYFAGKIRYKKSKKKIQTPRPQIYKTPTPLVNKINNKKPLILNVSKKTPTNIISKTKTPISSIPSYQRTQYRWPVYPYFNQNFLQNKNRLKSLVKKINYKTQLPTPKKVKGIYLTSHSFLTATRRTELINLVETTELNTMVIDLRDSSGNFMFQPEIEILKKLPISQYAIKRENYKALLTELQNKGIYTIARIVTFQDSTAVNAFPNLGLHNTSGTLWKNWKGITWLDMTNEKAWRIPVAQAREAALLGFDEIQFDYIRFPSDGPITQISYDNLGNRQKFEVIADFYKYASSELAKIGIPLSVDLFGLTYHYRTDKEYDMNIGQRLVDAALYFDFISPMVYPSHYPSGYLQLANPATNPYAVVNKALSDGNLIMAELNYKKAKSRPWIQDFDLGANYTADMVKAQIQACDENNTAGWLLWNARNIYTVEALAPKTIPTTKIKSFSFKKSDIQAMTRFILQRVM